MIKFQSSQIPYREWKYKGKNWKNQIKILKIFNFLVSKTKDLESNILLIAELNYLFLQI